MKVETPRTKEVAGETLLVRGAAFSPPAGKPATTTLATIAGNFDAVKHLLSNRPLRRPNRTRPVVATEQQKPVVWEPANEATRQQVRRAVERARQGKFSESQPNLDADADLADRCEDLE